jgi:hypothetical protein
MRFEKRNGFGDRRRFFVALAPGPVNDGLLCDAKGLRFC